MGGLLDTICHNYYGYLSGSTDFLRIHSMTPTFYIVADDADITGLVKDRLIQLSDTGKSGMDTDEFELRIDGRGRLVTLPQRGAGIESYLSYFETGLTHMGRYVVDEITVSGRQIRW